MHTRNRETDRRYEDSRVAVALMLSLLTTMIGIGTLLGSPWPVLAYPWLVGDYAEALGPARFAPLVILAVAVPVWIMTMRLAARWIPLALFPAFVPAVALIASHAIVTRTMEARRAPIVEAFGAECLSLTSAVRSFHIAPQEWRFDLHGSAVKDGAPYAWSWREMAFYPLGDNVWPNVLPREIAACVTSERLRDARNRP